MSHSIARNRASLILSLALGLLCLGAAASANEEEAFSETVAGAANPGDTDYRREGDQQSQAGMANTINLARKQYETAEGRSNAMPVGAPIPNPKKEERQARRKKRSPVEMEASTTQKPPRI